jgi:tetratricopeptide (TPR) repeat protein
MDFDEQLRILQSAEGDPARLALASVDLLLAARPERERENVRAVLEAAAVVHWCDETILAALLRIPEAEAVGRLVRLRELTVVEPFPARGPGVVNVHEAIRLALRARLHAEDPNRMRALSARAHTHFAKDNASHAVVEALYQRFIAEPEVAERECRKLYRRLSDATEYDSLLALGAILAELLDSNQPGLASGLVRGTALLCLSRIRRNYPRLEDREDTTVTLAREALREYQAVGAEDWMIAMAYQNLGNALGEQGDLDAALIERRAGLEIQKTLAQANPSDAQQQSKLSIAYNKLGRVLRLKGDFFAALDSYRANLAIAVPLAEQNPNNNRLQSHLAVSHDDVGDVLRDQGQLPETLEQYHAALAIRERLVVREPGTYKWQLDVFESLTKIGNVLRDQGDLRGALGSYSDSLAIIRRLANRYITNARWQNDFASVCAKMADVLLRLPDGKQAEALELIGQGQGRIEALARAHPLTPSEQKVGAHLARLALRARGLG